MRDRVQIGSWFLPPWLVMGLGAVAYFALAELGLSLASLHEVASPVWPASGLAVVLIRLFGLRMWPAIMLGALAANSLLVGFGTAIPISIGNTLEGVVGGLLVQRIIEHQSDGFLPTRTVGTALAAFLATTISASFGVASLYLAGSLAADLVGPVWFTWWAGDALGVLVVTPALLAFRGIYRSALPVKRALVGSALVAAAVAGVLTIVWHDGDSSIAIFLAFPIILFAGRWLGPRAFGWTTLLFAIGLIAETIVGAGPFSAATLNDSLLNMQMFIAMLAFVSLMLVDLRSLDIRMPSLVLLIGCAIAAGAFALERRDAALIETKKFEGLVHEATERISERMAIYVNAMRGGAGLFAVNPQVSRIAWRDFTASLALEKRYPGIVGVGFIVPLKSADLPGFVAAAQQDGAPQFAVKNVPDAIDPRVPGDERFVILFIEPSAQNAPAIGLDMASEQTRRDGAIAARDTGQPTASGRLTLVQDPQHRAGFLLYLPVYNTIDEPQTLRERRSTFRGWIYAPIATEDFFVSALRGFEDQLSFEAFDGASTEPADLLVARAPQPRGSLRRDITIELSGHPFTLRWMPGPNFTPTDSRDGELYSCGIVLLAVLLAVLIANLQSLRLRAAKMAEQMTVELSTTNRRLELVVAGNNDGIWEWDLKTGQFWAAPRCSEMLGYTQAELPNDRAAWKRLLLVDDQTSTRAQIAELRSGARQRIDVVQRYRHKDGHIVSVRNRAVGVMDSAGSLERIAGALTDITALLQAEQRLRTAVGAMENGFALFDADDRLVIFNDSFMDAKARPAEGDLIGKSFEDIIRGFTFGTVTAVDALPDREAWVKWRMERHRSPLAEPIEVQWTDGRWMRIVERRTDDGGTVVTRTDITALKRAEQRLVTAIDVMDSGFALFDADDRLVLHNKAFVDKSVPPKVGNPRGYTFEELARAYAYGDVTAVAALLGREDWIKQRMEVHRNPPDVPFEQQSTDGKWLRVAERRTSDGGSVATWTDITELKHAEARLQDAIESINEGFALMDADRRYVVVNQHFKEMHPHAGKAAVKGALLEDVIRYAAKHGEYPGVETSEQIEAIVDDRVSFYESGERYTGERQLQDGRWILVSQHPTSTGGYVSIRSDITEQKQRESELRAAKESLEKRSEELLRLTEALHEARRAADLANLSKSQFLANMAHELRTPLNAINGYSEMILSGIFGPIQPEKYGEFVGMIHKGGEHLLSLINDILDLSKIEAGKIDLNVEAISSAQIAHSVIETVRPLAGSRGVDLKTQLAPDCPILHADSRAARQILLNLLSNAVKFTPNAGSVTLEMSRHDGVGIDISVVDTGIGMTPEQTIKAMELYGQVQTDLTKKHAGTGLGLPLVKALAERHGGTLSLVSVKDKGTTATVFLPWRSDLPIDLN